MSKVEDFLSPSEEAEVIQAIRTAEKNTSGEIRVHLEASCKENTFKHAKKIFHFLHMDNTKNGNGVLIYVAVEDKNLVILGDSGIDKVVPNNFWESTRDSILQNFKEGNTKNGLVEGILMAGEQLKKYFPYQESDTNELSDAISKKK